MKNVSILLFLSMILFGCAMKKNTFQSAGIIYPPHTGDVKILDKLPEKYTEIGWIHIVDNKTWIEMYSEAKKKARQHGANAIIYSQQNNKFKGAGTRSIVCRAIFVEEDKAE